MNVQFTSTIYSINELLAAGYKLELMPEWRTNEGWTINYTEHDVPGKVGLIITRDWAYALIVGNVVDGVFVNVEEEASGEYELEYFYKQFENYRTRVVTMVTPHGDETEITRDRRKAIDNSILTNAWQTLPNNVTHEEKMYFEGARVVCDIRRKHGGNGVVSVKCQSGKYFYVQFEKNEVRAFNTKGYTRETILQQIGGILDTVLR
uniref:Uncharacterized protein n=1 Tax=Pseudomonas phage RVTF4 TaxID=3236931 RepID=A0AB39CCK0_9VIRU